MSYSPRHARFGRVRLATVAVAVAATFTACGGSDTSEDSVPAVEASPESSPVQLVDPDGFSAALAASPEMPLINVHIPYEDHIEGTDAFIAFDSILESPDLPTDKAAPIALYCRSGNMSAQASAALADAGYTDIIDLDGGMNAWESSGSPLIDDPSVVE
ncbi:MAG: rhodanese-like domain-containing protein [Ilumatobacter sp.]|uniref:rhodanese-like domain-containing protein n=1 Tax=Ilumatobacter sp. TaxID=1967498 RepID=UPI003C77BFF1